MNALLGVLVLLVWLIGCATVGIGFGYAVGRLVTWSAFRRWRSVARLALVQWWWNSRLGKRLLQAHYARETRQWEQVHRKQLRVHVSTIQRIEPAPGPCAVRGAIVGVDKALDMRLSAIRTTTDRWVFRRLFDRHASNPDE